MSFKKKYYLSLIFLFIISSFFRLYRISSLTGFLGDQGRTGIVIYNAFVNKTFPLAGPPVLTGQHLGPFFYYIIAPVLVLFNFNPVSIAVFICLLDTISAVILFYIGTQLFGFSLGFLIALLYTVSPYLVTASRQIWEPTLIPFFVTILLFSFLKVYKEKKIAYTILTYSSLGILLQLHYPNILLFIPTTFFFLWIFLHEKNTQRKRLIIWTSIGIVLFLLTLFPFLFYEGMHEFSDLRDIIYLLLFPVTSHQSSSLFYINSIDFTFRLFKYVFPIHNVYIISVLAIITSITPLIYKKNFWHILFVIWFFTGIISLSLYRGVVFNHYLNFLVPIPFLIFGSFLNSLKNTAMKNSVLILLLVLILLHISHTDIFSNGSNDISRTQRITNEIIQLSKRRKFSFTLLSSESFSDLHYRYFFSLKHYLPQPITHTDYPLLFIICEKGPCPSLSEMRQATSVTAMCSSDHCEGNYPRIDLRFWKLKSLKIIDNSSIFLYERI